MTRAEAIAAIGALRAEVDRRIGEILAQLTRDEIEAQHRRKREPEPKQTEMW